MAHAGSLEKNKSLFEEFVVQIGDDGLPNGLVLGWEVVPSGGHVAVFITFVLLHIPVISVLIRFQHVGQAHAVHLRGVGVEMIQGLHTHDEFVDHFRKEGVLPPSFPFQKEGRISLWLAAAAGIAILCAFLIGKR